MIDLVIGWKQESTQFDGEVGGWALHVVEEGGRQGTAQGHGPDDADCHQDSTSTAENVRLDRMNDGYISRNKTGKQYEFTYGYKRTVSIWFGFVRYAQRILILS